MNCRPTSAADWWEDEPNILAGRDQVRKGTWLGVGRRGRFAFLTNFREVRNFRTNREVVFLTHLACIKTPLTCVGRPQAKYNSVREGPSRGALIVDYLKGDGSPMAFLGSLDTEVTSFQELFWRPMTRHAYQVAESKQQMIASKFADKSGCSLTKTSTSQQLG